MSRFRRVFMVQEPSRPIDLASAEALGPLTPLIGSRTVPSLQPGMSFRKIFSGIEPLGPHDALFATGGDPLGVFMAGMALMETGYDGPLNWLRWERDRDPDGRRLATGRYVPLEWDPWGKGGGLDRE